MSIDSNSWYMVSSVASNNTALRWCSLNIVCSSETNLTDSSAQWQFLPVDDQPTSTATATSSSASSSATVLSNISIRNRGKGPDSAISVSLLNTLTTTVGFTSVAGNDTAQQWNLFFVPPENSTGDGFWRIQNSANGSFFNMQTTNGVVYMGQQGFILNPNQAWVISKVVIPTTAPGNPTTTPDSDTNNDGGDKVSGATIAGAVVGSVLGLFLIVGIALLLIRRRRKTAAAAAAASASTKPPTPPEKDRVVEDTSTINSSTLINSSGDQHSYYGFGKNRPLSGPHTPDGRSELA